MSDPALRIALLGYRGNPYSGGQGIYLKYLSRALTRLGHEVTVVGGPPYPQLDDGVGLAQLPSLDLYAAPDHVKALRWRHLRSFTDTFEWASMLTGGFPEPYTFGRRLLKWWKEHGRNFDVVHDNQSLCYALLTLQKQRVPVLSTIHHPITSDRDIALQHAKSRQDRWLIKRWHHFLRMQMSVAQRLRYIVTVSESSKKDICSSFSIPADRIKVVHNGIDGEEFFPEPGIQPECNRLIATASADQPLKGLVHLVRALGILRRQHPTIHLTVIGKPKSDGPAKKLIDELGLAGQIEFKHGLTTGAIRRLYATVQIAVVPSEYEGFGLPAGEAMACGVPLISTTGGALPEIVGDAGILVPPANPEALAQAIATLLANPSRQQQLRSAGRDRILSQFNWERAAAALELHYRRAMTN